MNTARTLIPILVLASICSSAVAQSLRGAWIVCTRDLELRVTLIDELQERELVLRNEYGIRSTIPISDVLFIVRNNQLQAVEAEEIVGAPEPQRSPVRLITLSDGQVVRGSIIEPDVPDELAISLIVGRKVLGDAHIPLERVIRIDDQGIGSTLDLLEAELHDDLVVTRNGDRIAGFIESLGPLTRITLKNGTELEIDTHRIASIMIANDSTPEPGLYLRLSDHESLRVSMVRYVDQQAIKIEIDGTSLGLEDTGNSISMLDSGSLEAVDVHNRSALVLSLSDLTPVHIEPTGDRDWTPSPIILDADASHPVLRGIDLQSPVRVTYKLPEGASRFACKIETPIEEWTDCVVRVMSKSNNSPRVLFEQRMNRDQPIAQLNIAIPASADELVIEVDPGVHGPIQDRVLLRSPRLLVQN